MKFTTGKVAMNLDSVLIFRKSGQMWMSISHANLSLGCNLYTKLYRKTKIHLSYCTHVINTHLVGRCRFSPIILWPFTFLLFKLNVLDQLIQWDELSQLYKERHLDITGQSFIYTMLTYYLQWMILSQHSECSASSVQRCKKMF